MGERVNMKSIGRTAPWSVIISANMTMRDVFSKKLGILRREKYWAMTLLIKCGRIRVWQQPSTTPTTGHLFRQEAENGEDWINYHYNKDGQLTQSVDRYGETEYFYNESGLLIQEIGPSVIGTYEYDKLGNVVTHIRYWRDDINRDYAGTIISYYFIHIWWSWQSNISIYTCNVR